MTAAMIEDLQFVLLLDFILQYTWSQALEMIMLGQLQMWTLYFIWH